jgi:hypothetical protein
MSLRVRVPPKAKTAKARLRSWGVLLIRKRGEFLGFVEATTAEAAEIAAVTAFNLTEDQRKRLVVRERLS